MMTGLKRGFLLGGAIGAAVVIVNVIGAPEVEITEGAVAASGVGRAGITLLMAGTMEPGASAGVGFLSFGSLFSPIGTAIGFGATAPTCGTGP
jgi:hypothetical protein